MIIWSILKSKYSHSRSEHFDSDTHQLSQLVIDSINSFTYFFPRCISTRPTYLEWESSRITIHIQNLSCEVEVLVFSWFHRIWIEFICRDSSCSDELISRSALEQCEWDTIPEKIWDFFSIDSGDRSCESDFYMWKIFFYKCLRKSPWKFLREDTCDELLRMTQELILQKYFPLCESHRREGREMYHFLLSFSDILPRKVWWSHKRERTGYPEMCEEKGSVELYFFVIPQWNGGIPLIYWWDLGVFFSNLIIKGIPTGWQNKWYSSIFKGKSRKFMEPGFPCEKARKWWSERCYRMTECSSKGISISARSRMTICIPACSDDEDISFVVSMRSSYKESFRISFL